MRPVNINHGEIMHKQFPVSCPRSGGSLQALLPHPGLFQEDVMRTKGITMEELASVQDKRNYAKEKKRDTAPYT